MVDGRGSILFAVFSFPRTQRKLAPAARPRKKLWGCFGLPRLQHAVQTTSLCFDHSLKASLVAPLDPLLATDLRQLFPRLVRP